MTEEINNEQKIRRGSKKRKSRKNMTEEHRKVKRREHFDENNAG